MNLSRNSVDLLLFCLNSSTFPIYLLFPPVDGVGICVDLSNACSPSQTGFAEMFDVLTHFFSNFHFGGLNYEFRG
jgi:hypothetical protein